jgi:bacterioferritin-associated ferredoxin
MYVCICNEVTESQIMRAVEEGVRNLRELQAYLGILLECGRCARDAHSLLRESRQAAKAQCNNGCPNVLGLRREKIVKKRQEDVGTARQSPCKRVDRGAPVVSPRKDRPIALLALDAEHLTSEPATRRAL